MSLEQKVPVATGVRVLDAAHLALCWNSHSDLVAELGEHVKALEAMGTFLVPWAALRLTKGRAALAAARGEAVSA